MAGFKKLTPEQQAEQDRKKAEERLGKAILKAERAFWQSAAGQARMAKRNGQRWYQVEMPVVETTRTLNSMLFGDVDTKNRRGTGQGALISAIEEEGWELFEAGFVFHETGQVSRDKLLSSGQSIKTTGQTFGIYLFRATSEAAREDEPWVEAVVQAHQSAPQLPPAGWYADPEVDGQMRRWDGVRWTSEIKPVPIARLTEGTSDGANTAHES
ncbi:MAG: DUF2510 domain-containing protein [Conexibacter sp.]